jgi:hypothetical protein
LLKEKLLTDEQQQNEPSVQGPTKGERTVIRSLALGRTHWRWCNCAVDVRDGKVIRIRPLHYDWKHDLSKSQFMEIHPEWENYRTDP